MRVTLVEPSGLYAYHSSNRYAFNVAQAGEASGRFVATRLPAPLLPAGRFARRPWRRDATWTPGNGAPDVVHFAMAGVAHHAARFDAPSVATHHDLLRVVQLPQRLPSPLTNARWREVGQLAKWLDRGRAGRAIANLLAADHIIAVSQTMADELCQRYPAARGRVSVVPNVVGAHIQPYSDAEAWLQQRGIHLPDGPKVLMVGTSNDYKNIPLALRAMALPELRRATLVRVGRALRPEQAALARTLGGAIVHLGSLDDESLARVYCACDVLIQPSLWEGFGIPVIEAFAAGTPVVSSDGGALPEVAGDAGLVVSGTATAAPAPGRLAAFAASVALLLRDSALRGNLRERGLARAERFRPAAVGPLLADAYERAVAARRARFGPQ
ncbi:MAG: glycosyltransferase family 4 protein [Dehalococcoidia bacterium]